MRSPASRARFALFRCPVCCGTLALSERRLICTRGHSFDLARSGYVNLAPARRSAPAAGGDLRTQLEHRERLLMRGHLDFVADVIAGRAGCPIAILDGGCGTGFHLARVMEHSRAGVGAGIDLSKEAASWCARRYPELDFVVMDIWHRWPIHDESVDLVTSIFAPKNYAEMARVLRRNGLLALVFPGPHHLEELRRAFGLLGLSEHKAERYAAILRQHVGETSRDRVVYRAMFDREDIRSAILMGPNARHGVSAVDGAGMMPVTIDVEFLFAHKR